MTRKTWTRFFSATVGLASAAFGLLIFTGCSTDAPNAPDTSAPVFSGENVPFAWSPTDAGHQPMGMSSGSGDWYQVASETLDDDGGVVAGSRFTLIVPEDAWDEGEFGEDVEFTINERDPNLIDAQLGPHGIDFDTPVTIIADYSDTNVDPDSPNYDGTSPSFFYYNPATDVWEPFAGVNDTSAKTYTVDLEHFSRYALFGTPGW